MGVYTAISFVHNCNHTDRDYRFDPLTREGKEQ